MKFWFLILKESKSLNTILLLTFFITIMGLLSPIFIIHIFNRYIAFGLQGTLFFLLSGALLVAVFEYIFRNIRSKILCELLINPIKFFKLDLIKTFFERENKTSKRNFVEIIDFNNNFFQFLSPKVQSNLLDSIFATLIIIILFFLDLLLATIFLILVIIFLLLQQRLTKNKNLNLEKLNLSKNDKLIIKEIGTNQELLKSTLAFKYSGYYLENYLDKKLYIGSKCNRESCSNLINFVKDRPGHDKRYSINSSKISNELGWKPYNLFSESLLKTINWYIDNEAWCKNVSAKNNFHLKR